MVTPMSNTNLVVVLFHSALQLLLEEENDILNIPASDHLQSDTDSFALDFHILAEAVLSSVPPCEMLATHLESTFRMSMTIPSSTCSCFDRKVSNRPRTMSLTLLSDSLTMSSAKAAAAAERQRSSITGALADASPLTAAGF